MSLAPYQLLPPLTTQEEADLTASIHEHGVMVPVLVDEDGDVIDGHHRQKIADHLGIDYPVEVRAGLTHEQKLDLALRLNIARRHLTREQKRELIAASLKADPELSDRQHAERTGADHKTVGSQRVELEGRGEIPHAETRTDSTGRTQPATKPERPATPEDVEDAAEGIDDGEWEPGGWLAPGEADAIADELNEAHGDDAPEHMADAVAENVESKRTPKPSGPPTKPDLGGGISHPARYSAGMVETFDRLLCEVGLTEGRVLDPFAGTGLIHGLTDIAAEWTTVGIEIEPEWAGLHERTQVGSALALPFDDDTFDAVVTSPTYGNRLADSHNASDPETRRSYTHDLGRELSEGSSGAMQWGHEYREFHIRAWREVYRVLNRGGIFLLNIKDHIRSGVRQEVSAWHLEAAVDEGFKLRWVEWIPTSSMRAGANGEARIDGEYVFVLEAR